MRRAYVAIALVVAAFIDTVVFARINIFGITPDCVLVMIVTVGILAGAGEAAVWGLGVGLILDVLYGRAVGISAICYLIAGVAGGIFYKKYYADNLVIPTVTTAVCALLKELTMAIVVILAGSRINIIDMFMTYVLPCALMAAALSIPANIFMKPLLVRSGRKRYERSGGSK